MSKRTRSLTLAVLAAPVIVLALSAVTVNADTIHVCWDGSGDYLTIQEGIDAAQDGDEVVVCDGVYTGPGNRDLVFGGKALALRSANGPENCIIDCQAAGRAFLFAYGDVDTLLVDGFTITNGFADRGGAISCGAAAPTIHNCTIIGNTASQRGGGICIRLGRPTIENCTFANNTADEGAGIYYTAGTSSTATISNCTVTENVASSSGGGIFCGHGNPTIIGCTITTNTAGDAGGGMFLSSGSQAIINCTIAENTASAGGGIYCTAGACATAINCTISRNTASAYQATGGGLFCVTANGPKLINCAITANLAVGEFAFAGAIYCYESDVCMVNCTLTQNAAVGEGYSYAGGVLLEHADEPVIASSILWGNTPGQLCLPGHAHPLVTHSDVQGGWPGPGVIDADPLFVDPDGADNDPNTWEDNDYHLSAGSPCIDAGCNWALPPDMGDLDDDDDTDEITPFDLDGEGRFFDDPDTADTGCGCPPVVDMGAYEFGDTGPQPCPGDLDCDRIVGHSDLGIMLSAWQWSDEGDLDCDGDTDQVDLGILLGHWGEVCP